MLRTKAPNYRKIGDGHRDEKEWAKAAVAYRVYLLAHPEDTPIWVQLGHALKESGDVSAAEKAYRHAAEAQPEDADVHLQLGHVQKIQSKFSAAIAAYRRAYKLNPSEAVLKEIRNLKSLGRESANIILGKGCMLFSVQDLFVWFNSHKTMSGIQRVQVNIAMNAIVSQHSDVYFIINDLNEELQDGAFWLISHNDLRKFLEYVSGERVDLYKLRRLLADCQDNAEPVQAVRGSTIILLGVFWGLENSISLYMTAKRSGARIGAYIYDIIPVSHPEYCDAGLVRHFSTSLCELCLVVDFILTISDYSLKVLKEFLAENGGRAIPMKAVPLAHSLGSDSCEKMWPAALQRLKGREYVMYVSTIEGRKNHIYLVNVWRQLIEDGMDPPDLIFLGRKGWRAGGLFDFLDGTGNLGGRVHLIEDLSDAELNALYESCLFTAFTSFVEGWGLPVGESMIHGKLCVASNTTSIPEVAGEFVEYIDPYNLRNGIEVISRLLNDREYLADRQRNIAENFKPRTWQVVGDDFIAQVRLMEQNPLIDAPFASLPEGRLFRPGDLIGPEFTIEDYVVNPLRFLISESFYQPGSFGAWMRGRFGQITFQTELPVGEPVIVFIDWIVPEGERDCTMTVQMHSGNRPAPSGLVVVTLNDLGKKPLTRLNGVVGQGGLCRLTIEVKGIYGSHDGDHRDFAMGLAGIAFARASNLQARADILESLVFTSLAY